MQYRFERPVQGNLSRTRYDCLGPISSPRRSLRRGCSPAFGLDVLELIAEADAAALAAEGDKALF